MINFENMTIEQMKKYLFPAEIKKLEVVELGQLLSAARGIREYFAKQSGIEALVETTFWTAAEEELKKEFGRRNIELKVIKLSELYKMVNEELKMNYTAAKKVLFETFSQFETEALLELKSELMGIPGHEKNMDLVLKLINEYVGISSRNAMLN